MRFLFPLLSMLLLAGCASFDQAQMARMQSQGVPPPLLAKLRENRTISPPEIMVLSRHGVSDEALVRYLHRNGVGYVATHEDAVQMRAAGVGPRVVDAVAEEGTIFAREHTPGYSRPTVGMAYGDPYLSYPNPNGFDW